MNLQKAALAMLTALAVGSAAYAEEAVTEPQSEAGTEAVTELSSEAGTEAGTELSSEAGTEAGTGTLSDKWSDFQIQIDGTVYQFPMTYADWTALGWTASDTVDEQLEPYQYGMLQYEMEDRKCTAYVLNLGINNANVEDCLVAGISLDNFYWEPTDGEVVLPGGLIRDKANGEDIQAAYGAPSDTYEGDLYTEYTYELDYNCSYELTVYKESGVLEDIDVRNFTEPEGFEAGEASTEVPAEITAYEKPAALSAELTAYEIELDGQVYALPVPVSTLLADGWEINPSETDEHIMANSSGWVGLIKGGQSFHTMARNEADYATVPENCWIEELEVGGYTLEMDGSLPGGVRVGITEDEFLTLLEKAGMKFEVEESGDFKYYSYNEKEYDQCCEVIVFTGEDGNFPKNTVTEVSCSNAFD